VLRSQCVGSGAGNGDRTRITSLEGYSLPARAAENRHSCWNIPRHNRGTGSESRTVLPQLYRDGDELPVFRNRCGRRTIVEPCRCEICRPHSPSVSSGGVENRGGGW